ncbi:hypothetical protein F2Z80_16540 [Vibrio fortis]|uniref:Uncharacterized protein n=1 Tax=Vibrio fortis TaxID=212667 RepID=A0A5N3S1L7_9VIBR|nr:hypothetical protein [Vibrio fortis]KAB0300728.1 hypothetical protein F2Z80_16540 [Vibrio fortis]
MKIGIAAEGKTDQHTIENILIGYFKGKGYQLSSDEVLQAQPSGDATDQNNINGFGNWTNLLDYLQGTKIQEDVDAYDYLILQVDTDVCENKPFSVPRTDGGATKPVETLVIDVVNRLIQLMNIASAQFYNDNKDKIIFAISVHSIECWIFKYFENEKNKSGVSKVLKCEAALSAVVNRKHKKLAKYLEKTKDNYFELTKGFRKPKALEEVKAKDKSFEMFYDNLSIIAIPEMEEDNDW